MKNNKLLGLQILRGIAAWIVVFHHMDQSLYEHQGKTAIWDFFRHYGAFGVDIFFVLSGYIMFFSVKKKGKDGFSFFVDRVFRIVPVYWAMTIMLILSAQIFSFGAYKTFYTAETLVKSFLLIPSENPNGYGYVPFLYVGWTLIYEMFFYIVLSVALIIRQKNALIISVVFLGALPLALGEFELLGRSNFLLYEFVAGVAIAYILGLASKSKHARFLVSPWYIFPLILINVAAIIILNWGPPTRFITASFIVIAFLLIEPIVKKAGSKINFFVYLGDISYSTYLVHPIVIGWFKLTYLTVESQLLRNLISLVYLVLVYFLSRFSFQYIENNNYLHKLKERIKKGFVPHVAINKS